MSLLSRKFNLGAVAFSMPLEVFMYYFISILFGEDVNLTVLGLSYDLAKVLSGLLTGVSNSVRVVTLLIILTEGEEYELSDDFWFSF